MIRRQNASVNPKLRARKGAAPAIVNMLFSNQLAAPGIFTVATKSDASGVVHQLRNSMGTTWRRRGVPIDGMHSWVSLDCKSANFIAVVETSDKGILNIETAEYFCIIEESGAWLRTNKNGLVEIWDQESLTLTNRLPGTREVKIKYLIDPLSGQLRARDEESPSQSVMREVCLESGDERKNRIEEELSVRGLLDRKRTRRDKTRSSSDSIISILDFRNAHLLLSNQRRIAKQYADG